MADAPRIARDGVLAARGAGLAYVSCNDAGIHRKRAGKGFVYLDVRGRRVRDRATIDRIRAIVIPPAWTHVWICARADGHIQAVGRDARGRKQYRYHPEWRTVRDRAKFDGLAAFARSLPELRERVERDMRARGLGREKVLAALVRLLETTLIRVGNDEYARANASYGLTTLHDDHVKIRGPCVRFDFVGKSGIERHVELRDRRLAKIVAQCRDVPGPGLFQYYDERGKARAVGSTDVNAYIREIAGKGYTAKYFRTWGATVYAANALRVVGAAASERDAKKKVLAALRVTSDRLGNTPTVCRASYVHPAVLEAYRAGTLERAYRRPHRSHGLAPDEEAVLSIVARRTPTSLRRAA